MEFNLPRIILNSASPSVLWIIFGIAMIFVLLMTLVFLYHWGTFSQSKMRAISFQFAYLIVTGVLIAVAVSMLSLYAANY